MTDSTTTLGKWKTIYSGNSDRTYEITCTGGANPDGNPIELLVEVGGEEAGTLGKGDSIKVEGKKIRIQAQCETIFYSAEEV